METLSPSHAERRNGLKQQILHSLEYNVALASTVRRIRGWLRGVGWGAFHCDTVYRQMTLEMLRSFPFTSFVETGTFRGYSTEFIAKHFPQLPVYTTEVVKDSYELSTGALSRYSNVTTHLGNSSEWIHSMLKERRFGEFPLFYLDAHWQSYWPLRDELKHVAASKSKAVIVIDDFEVPGRPEFGFDIDGGLENGSVGAGEKCNLDYILPSLPPTNTYHAIFPKYSREDAKLPGPPHASLRGHLILFQNAPAEFETCRRLPLIEKHYKTVGFVTSASAS